MPFQGIPIFMSSGGAGYLLDGLTEEPTVAFSLRRVKRGADRCIRVKRSSDNAEQDIGFDVNGNLDQTALTTFCGAGNGFVVRWYDQSINGLNAASDSFPPRIVSSGVVETKNGKPCLNFIAASFNLMLGTVSPLYTSSGSWNCFAVASYNNNSTPYSIWDADHQSGVRLSQFIRSNDTPGLTAIVSFTSTGTVFVDTQPIATTAQALHYSIRTQTAVQSYLNNVSNGSTATTGVPRSTTPTGIGIGCSNNGGIQRLDGTIQEIIHFGSTTDYRTTLTDKINSYYGIF